MGVFPAPPLPAGSVMGFLRRLWGVFVGGLGRGGGCWDVAAALEGREGASEPLLGRAAARRAGRLVGMVERWAWRV